MVRFTRSLLERFNIRGARPDSITRLLSGGQLQRFLLAREMALNPRVIVAVHPTRGLDVAATQQVQEWLVGARDKGASVLLISEDLDEVMQLSDRIAVIYEGEIVGSMPAAGANREQIGLMMAGAHRLALLHRVESLKVAISVRLERRASLPLAQRILVLSVAVMLGAVAAGSWSRRPATAPSRRWGPSSTARSAGLTPFRRPWPPRFRWPPSRSARPSPSGCSCGTSAAKGQFYMGACCATGVELIGGPAGWPAVILLPAMLVAGFVGGAAWALLPAWLRAWHGVSEIITTLMLNYVAILWVNYLVYGPWKDPAGHNFPISPRFPDNATFARMGDGQLHTGLFVPIVAAAVLVFVLARTRWGYELRIVGENPEAARYAGINVRSTMLTAMLVSGGMAGVAGMVQVAGIIHLLNGQLSSNYGYTAIIIAWLAQLHPVAVLVVAVLFGALVNGGFAVSQVGIPQALGAVLQGMILFFVLGIGDVFTRYRLRIVTRARWTARRRPTGRRCHDPASCSSPSVWRRSRRARRSSCRRSAKR